MVVGLEPWPWPMDGKNVESLQLVNILNKKSIHAHVMCYFMLVCCYVFETLFWGLCLSIFSYCEFWLYPRVPSFTLWEFLLQTLARVPC